MLRKIKTLIKQHFCSHMGFEWKKIGEDNISETYNGYCKDCEKVIYKDINQIDPRKYIKKLSPSISDDEIERIIARDRDEDFLAKIKRQYQVRFRP